MLVISTFLLLFALFSASIHIEAHTLKTPTFQSATPMDKNEITRLLADAKHTGMIQNVANDVSRQRKSKFSDTVANILGYVMGYGSLFLYVPIIFDLATKGGYAEGCSLVTWTASLAGLSLSCIYPMKKGFAISTYLEFVVLSIECFFICGTISVMQGRTTGFIIGSSIYSLLYLALMKFELNPRMLSFIQIVSLLVCNYALVPQILLNAHTKRYGWSEITAFLSASGNALRIFTTLQLTKDRLVLIGFLIGFTSNSVLFAQSYIYPKL